MDEKQIPPHRQHFNLSEQAKEKLEQLTARRYPGKKRKQSQLVEDLITQAFAKEYTMSTPTQGMQEREPDWLAPATYKALDLAQREAHRLEATEVTTEHLLLGLVKQRDRGVLHILATLRVNVSVMSGHLDQLFISGDHREPEWVKHEREKLNKDLKQIHLEMLYNDLKPGELRHGIVSHLANFGAFVDLGGADGLIHNSQLAWSQVHHPGEVLHVGQEVEVQVLSVDKEKQKIALSLKRAKVDPWTTVQERYAPGQFVTAIVTRVTPFGTLARIEDGIEGLIHPTQLPAWSDREPLLHEGTYLQLRILRIDAQHRRLFLGMVGEAGGNTLQTPFTESERKYGAEEIEKILSEDISAAIQESTIPDVRILRGSIPLSGEALVSLQEALWIARRMNSPLVGPEHLFLSLLRNQHIQACLSPLLPFPEMLSGYRAVSSEGTSRQKDTCPLCKRLMQSHWKHCAYCGQRLLSVCPQCDTPRAEIEGVRFCYECGFTFE